MRLDDYDYDDSNMSFATKSTIIISVAILVIFLLVLLVNKDRIEQQKMEKAKTESVVLSPEEQARLEEKNKVESLLTGETLTSEDLTFWDLYSVNDESSAASEQPVIEPETVETTQQLDPSEDGLHTLITYANGEEEWVSINTHLERSTYDYGGLVLDGELMKYYENSSLKSFVGASLSKADGEVNIYQLKKEGIDFVMLKLGQRGYQSGEITLDEKFEENLKLCIDAGIPFGVCFSTHAITTDEAIEEGDFIITKLNEFHETYEFELEYPIVINLDPILNDADRCDNLDKNERTVILNTLLPKITQEGYSVMIYANKEWLIKNVYLSHLTSYDIWLDQTGDVPDYPYQFVMWHYTNAAICKGSEMPLNLSISFVDFSIR